MAVCDYVVDVDDRDLGAVAEEIRKLGRRSLAIQVDVTRKNEVDAMARHVNDELGPADVLANNAGTFIGGSILETDEESWDKVIDVNLKGCFLCTKAVIEGMVARGTGSIVNISSVSGIYGPGATASYCASKAGIIMLTKQLACEMGRYNIRANTIAPGAMATDWLSHISPEGSNR